nr:MULTISPECIES: HAMP domain-containing sensor histidine kinase [unclassified Plantibacter]
MRTLLFTGLAVIAVGAAGTAWALTSLSLGPVRRLRRSADALSAGSSSDLLAVGEARDEISDLARTLNELIERLRDSARRERQFVSDASHELRTPIALLNAQLQVAVAEASSVEQMVRDVDGARRNVTRLAALVTSLLELSAIEAAHDGVRSSIGALGREADDATDRARFRAQDTAISILYDGPELLASGDGTDDSGGFPIGAESFGRIVDNLLNNALRAVGDGGVIDVRLTVQEAVAWLVVTDTGGGMDPAFEPFALDRFTRQDASRTGGQGTGLGLAIVAALVRNADGTIELDNRPGDGLTIRIGLPAVQAAPSPDS